MAQEVAEQHPRLGVALDHPAVELEADTVPAKRI
jgi:hypothetical protein